MTSFIVSLAIRLTAIMLAGGLAALALRRSSYAVRHVVIAATLACAIALPPLMILMPEWRVGVLPPRLTHTQDAPPAHVTSHLEPAASAPSAARESRRPMRPVLVTSALDAPSSQEHTAGVRVPFT